MPVLSVLSFIQLSIFKMVGAAPVVALQEYYEALDNMSSEEYAAKEKKLVRKIDIRLMPMLVVMIIMK